MDEVLRTLGITGQPENGGEKPTLNGGVDEQMTAAWKRK